MLLQNNPKPCSKYATQTLARTVKLLKIVLVRLHGCRERFMLAAPVKELWNDTWYRCTVNPRASGDLWDTGHRRLMIGFIPQHIKEPELACTSEVRSSFVIRNCIKQEIRL